MPPYSKCNIKNKKEERNFSSFLSDLDTLRNAKHMLKRSFKEQLKKNKK